MQHSNFKSIPLEDEKDLSIYSAINNIVSKYTGKTDRNKGKIDKLIAKVEDFY